MPAEFYRSQRMSLAVAISLWLLGSCCFAQELDGEYIAKWKDGELVSMTRIGSTSDRQGGQQPARVVSGRKAVRPFKPPRELPKSSLQVAGLASKVAAIAQPMEFTVGDTASGTNSSQGDLVPPPVAIIDAVDLLDGLEFDPSDVSSGTQLVASDMPPANCATSSGAPWGTSREEYVCDGGDSGSKARVKNDWSLMGLEVEDTVAHFDTLDGKVEVVASNKAYVYAPRFAAVRQVRRLHINEQHRVAVGSHGYQGANDYIREVGANAVKQPLATVRAVGTDIGVTMLQNDRGFTIDDVDIPTESRNQILPYEDLRISETQRLNQMDSPILLDGSLAARAWSNIEMPQVTMENGVAFVRTGVSSGEEAVVYEMPKGKPRLRLTKQASECAANPGDTIRFTIKYDNVGNQPIGNVTILDMLTTRLKLVEGSDYCSDDSVFFTSDEGDALKLRWEVAKPLEAGEGGLIRFDCIVR